MNRRIIDLSILIEEGMQTFAAPWHLYTEITILGRHGIENRETRKLVMGTHSGTHVDAPRHFIAKGNTIDELELDRFVGDATVVDFSTLPERTEISQELLEQAIGIRPTERIVLRFDWDQHLGTNKYYIDHPYLSAEACTWLVEQDCRLLAMDTPQPDNPLNGRQSDNDSPNHKILLGNGVVLVEYLINLSQITRSQVMLVAAPLRIREGDGAPARVFAIEEQLS